MPLGKKVNLPEPQFLHQLNVRNFCPTCLSGFLQGSNEILYVKVFEKLYNIGNIINHVNIQRKEISEARQENRFLRVSFQDFFQ